MPAHPLQPIDLTRAPQDNAELARRLRHRGLSVLEWPALATRLLLPPGGRAALEAAIARAEIIVLTSRRGAEAAEEILGPLAAAFADRRVACIGPATAAAIAERGLSATWTASGSGSTELAALLIRGCAPGSRLLLLRSAAADEELPLALAGAGLHVEDQRLYEPIEPMRPDADVMPSAGAIIVCASASAARQILSWHPSAAAWPFVAIGATTAAELTRLGILRVEIARASDDDALEHAVLSSRPSP